MTLPELLLGNIVLFFASLDATLRVWVDGTTLTQDGASFANELAKLAVAWSGTFAAAMSMMVPPG